MNRFACERGSMAWLRLFSVISILIAAIPAQAQNRGVYPLGMSAVNSGITPEPGFTYSNQLLFYSRDEAKDDNGNTIGTGSNSVIMDMNTFTWVSKETFS